MLGYRLARACGRLNDVNGLLDSLSQSDLEELVAYDRLEGIDNERKWLKLFAILQIGFATLANLWSKNKIPFKYFNPRHFDNPIIKTKSEVKQASQGASVMAQRAFLSQIVAAHNSGRV